MGRGRIKKKVNRRRRDLTKKARVLCDFCGFSSRYEQRPHEQDHEAVSEFKRLRLLTRRMTCKDLDGLSFTEVLLLEAHLKDVLLIVKDQKKKIKVEEDKRLRKQTKEAEDEDGGTRREVLVPCQFSSSSSGERQEKQGDEAVAPPQSTPQFEFERRNAESMEIKFERLWLLKERMNGRELDGMTYAELSLLEDQIKQALVYSMEHRSTGT